MPTIMIVDDDPLILRALSRALVARGYNVVTHDSGFGLSGVVREHDPDLLLLDVNMPGLSGDGALSTLRAMAARFGTTPVPVVLHSGLPEQELRSLARACGAKGHICKPAPNGKLLETIQRVLNDSTSAAETGS
ncbi:MAG: response regulator [Nannocystaceae bacterium]|nr:response regulator [Nannocystaceae bacterium]